MGSNGAAIKKRPATYPPDIPYTSQKPTAKKHQCGKETGRKD